MIDNYVLTIRGGLNNCGLKWLNRNEFLSIKQGTVESETKIVCTEKRETEEILFLASMRSRECIDFTKMWDLFCLFLCIKMSLIMILFNSTSKDHKMNLIEVVRAISENIPHSLHDQKYYDFYN